MDQKQDAFYRELLADLKIEAAEHRDLFTKSLMALEQADGEEVTKLTELMFREMHSLKGAARAVNLKDIETLCQSVESIMGKMKSRLLDVSDSLIDEFHEVVNVLDELLLNVEQEATEDLSYRLNLLVQRLDKIAAGGVHKTKNPASSFKDLASKMLNTRRREEKTDKPTQPDPKNNISTKAPLADQLAGTKEKEETVRISTKKLGLILRQAEELIAAKAMLQDEIDNMNLVQERHQVQLNHHDHFFHQVRNNERDLSTAEFEDYLQQQRDYSKDIQKRFREVSAVSQYKSRSISRMIDDLLIDIRSTLLIPFNTLTDMLPKTVRDLARSLGKSASLKVEGSEIEIDRRILEEIKDPITHLIRNCIDHGIESKEVRLTNSKNESAELKIQISQSEDRRVIISIGDDGAGIDSSAVVNSAVNQGFLSREMAEKLSPAEKLNLIFRSGVSSTKKVSKLSGRGLGMAIVAEKVEGLGGKITIESELGKGTKFTITLPLTLTTFRGVMVRCCDQKFMVNTSAVERVLRYDHSEIRMINDKEAIVLGGETIGLVSLKKVLNINKPANHYQEKEQLNLLLLNVAQKKIAFAVDDIIGEYEGIVKDLGPLLHNVENISGATVLGDGQVVPVINTNFLMKYGEESSFEENSADENVISKVNRKKVLIAEDSLTSRTLLRNILEVANYEVKTAVDGAQAFDFLRNESFDLLVSDIEMPNLTGIELVEKIRRTEGLKSMPVVLITSLGTPEDKQRGLDAGADAYFVKSSFDQSNLIEIVQQLI